MKRLTRITAFAVICCCIFGVSASSFKSGDGKRDSDVLFAEEEFRRGVQSYYRGSFNEAVLLFEKALSYLPTENLILDWLGRSYYRIGMEGTALQHWQLASDNGYGGLLLQNKMEIIRERRLTGIPQISALNYTEAGSFPGNSTNGFVFSQPVSVLPNSNGTCWVTAYGSNELLLIDVNGYIVSRVRGPLTGFDRPFDIIRHIDGNLLVSEFAGNRISVLDSKGSFLSSFGAEGVGNGQVVGPQYLALDSSGNVYVSDFGNARIVVFDKNGQPLFTFGHKTEDFSGFTAPAGIAVYNDVIYAADAATGAIYSFDRAGNYTGILVPAGTFTQPESLKVSGQYLIVSDSNRICTVDFSTGAVIENARTGSAPSRVLCAIPDVNGNVIASDFTANEIYVMSKLTELVGGLFVQIERVYSDNFPQVTVDLKVENRNRQPVVGLKAENFYLTENSQPVQNQTLVAAAAENTVCDITLIIDRSASSAAYSEAVEAAVTEIAAAMNGTGMLSVISAGEVPALEYTGSPADLGDFTVSALSVPVCQAASIEPAVRLAANNLITAEKKRAVILLTGASTIPSETFAQYSLSDLSAYLNNNSISFYTVNLSQNPLPEEIVYLTEDTNGGQYYVYRPEGLSGIVTDILNIPNGMYRVSFTSSLPSNFGQDYLPVEVEAYLLNRSGRDEAGYFAPLE